MKNIPLLIVLFFTSAIIYSQNVVINEIMSSNTETISDEDGESSDWIELYNTGSGSVDLTGYYLSDDSLNIMKWQFGDAVIEPNSYLIVFASDKDTFIGYWHTNFKISADGESIILSDINGDVKDKVDIPPLPADVSFARIIDGDLLWVLQEPTPGFQNSGGEIHVLTDTVSVSLPGGFYSSSLNVELSSGTNNIYYTLDGSDPDENSLKYSGAIHLTETTVLKAISIDQNYFASPAVHHTYFINEDSNLPVISLISDPYNLFDFNYGIYEMGPGASAVPPYHGANFWMDWERPAHVQFFDEEKKLGFSKNCGLEIYGGYTRSFPQKSFAVKFKNDYNATALEYPLFPGFYVNTFKSFVLRNSGNDFQFTHIRDAMMQSLIEDLEIDYLEYRPAAAYINGEYWGIYNIREKISEHYLANRHGVDPDNIDLLEGNMEVIHGDTLHYAALLDYISNNDMSTDEAYDYVNSRIDLDNCLLYWASHTYYNSQDWPANNLKYWRERSENGKWRWILFDLDFGFNLYETTGQSEDHVYYIFSGVETRPGSNPPWSTLLPRKLVENPRLKAQFINLIADLLNTKFSSDRVVNVINNMADNLGSEGVKHRERWNISQWTFDSHIQRMITFANERPSNLRNFVRNFFDCGTNSQINLNISEGGTVKLNSLCIDQSDSPWSGLYFYGNPVSLKAFPEKGFKFDGWSGSIDSNTDSIEVINTRTANLYASFSIDSASANDVVINEINYNSPDDFDSGDWIELYNRSGNSIDISGWCFSDSDSAHKFIVPTGTILNPDSYLVIIENDSAFKVSFPDVSNFIGETGFGLNGTGEFIKLANINNEIVDSLTYDDDLPWPPDADGKGATLELTNSASDNSVGTFWKDSKDHGTPGRVNSYATAIGENVIAITPSGFSLHQNYPNPFNPVTSISYSIPTYSSVTLKVYDILGSELSTLVNQKQKAGYYTVQFDGNKLASGVYFYRLLSENYSEIKKMVLLR
ncbi:MAG: CotH kinase family protein [Melioribacteraceae bacterium]|nr:CotH kinase family protein [Melioribacteraceae bacterium]